MCRRLERVIMTGWSALNVDEMVRRLITRRLIEIWRQSLSFSLSLSLSLSLDPQGIQMTVNTEHLYSGEDWWLNIYCK